jgi:hypothetical protein
MEPYNQPSTAVIATGTVWQIAPILIITAPLTAIVFAEVDLLNVNTNSAAGCSH